MKRWGRKFKGITLRFIGGLILAIVCFDLLAEPFEAGSIYIATVGITHDTWRGRMSTIGNVIGMIAGMLIVSFLN